MTDKGPLLLTSQFLSVDDYLSSTNGAFKAYMQNDGNFVVYNMLSSGQSDPRWASNVAPGIGPQYNVYMQNDGNLVVYEGPQGALSPIWASNVAPGVGPQYTLNMQDDGNLVVYRGLGDAIWSTKTPWSLSSIEMSNVVYDTNNGVMSNPQLQGEQESDLTNNTDVDQMDTFQFEVDYTETQNWSATAGIKVGVQATFNSGIPIIAEGKIQVSTEFSFSYTWGATSTTQKKYTDTIPVKVPPHAIVRCLATVSTSQVSVPYEANHVLFNLTDGKQLLGVLKGQFQGASAYQLQVTFTQT